MASIEGRTSYNRPRTFDMCKVRLLFMGIVSSHLAQFEIKNAYKIFNRKQTIRQE